MQERMSETLQRLQTIQTTHCMHESRKLYYDRRSCIEEAKFCTKQSAKLLKSIGFPDQLSFRFTFEKLSLRSACNRL